MAAKYSPGDEVQSISDPSRIGTIVQVCEIHAGIQWYRVSFGAAGRPKVAEVDLRPYVRAASPEENLRVGNLGGYKEFQRLITLTRLLRHQPLQNQIYAFNASRTRFYPFQFKPLLKFLDSHQHRLLLADEVGLGKTIEAGLILTELKARQDLKRVLVVCPANLTRNKWQPELERRFTAEFSVLNTTQFLEFLEKYEKSPEKVMLSGIISLESLRTDRVLNRLQELEPDFDLVIVDEAHHLRNFGTKTRQAGVILSRCAHAMLFLTATPIHLGNENMFSLLNILDEEEFPDLYTVDLRLRHNEPIVKAQICMGRIPPQVEEACQLLEQASRSVFVKDNPLLPEVVDKLEKAKLAHDNDQQLRRLMVEAQRDLAELNLLAHIFTRTRKRDVKENVARRQAVAIPVVLDDLEKEFYEAVTDYVRELSWQRHEAPIIQQWLLHMPQRRMASCIPAMVNYYKKEMAFASEDRAEDDYVEEGQDEGADLLLDFLNSARQRLQKLIAAWPSEGPDTKYREFIKILKKLRKEGPCKVIVFSFFKDTLKYLRERLTRDGFGCTLITGDEPPIAMRTEAITRFEKDPRLEVLLSSRVGTEGLDLQFCHTLFNYDLPWNPMEVEQRIGRLDRIGQQSPIIRIFNFWVEGTIEQRMLQRLYDRIKIFERSIGELEMILGEKVRQLEWELLSKRLTPEQEEEKIELTARVIENRLAELERLEGEAAKFLGADLYFDEEVEKIRQRRRYVTGRQIQRFLEDFLRLQCPRSRLAYDQGKERGELQPDEALQAFISKAGVAREIPHFFGREPRTIPITFDSQVSFEDPKIEFIHLLHPLIQAIANYYDEDQHSRIPCNAHHLVLATGLLPPGTYLYYIYKLNVLAARQRHLLEMVVLDEGLNLASFAEEAEILLGEMVEKGQEPKSLRLELAPAWADIAFNQANTLLHQRIDQIKKEVGLTNDAFLDLRLTSIRTFYQKKITRLQELLARGEETGKKEPYLRMRRSEIARRERELKNAEDSLEKYRQVQVEYDGVAAGILEVMPQ
ncbi:MAG: SNF2-related protein [Thermodesulfobacteriota bacterium]